MAQVAAATFGMGSIPFYVIQAATAVRPAPRSQHRVQRLSASRLGARARRLRAEGPNTRGDRLVYSNGMIILGIVAIGVLVIYQASLTTLIQLYIIGVFTSFSFGQIGMVRHWIRMLRETTRVEAKRDPRGGGAAHRTQGTRHQLVRRDPDRAGARHRHDHEVHARRVPRLHRDPDTRDPHDRREPLLPRRRARDPDRRARALRRVGRHRDHPRQSPAEARRQGHRLRPRRQA